MNWVFLFYKPASYLNWSEKLAHNEKVTGSSPVEATKKMRVSYNGFITPAFQVGDVGSIPTIRSKCESSSVGRVRSYQDRCRGFESRLSLTEMVEVITTRILTSI